MDDRKKRSRTRRKVRKREDYTDGWKKGGLDRWPGKKGGLDRWLEKGRNRRLGGKMEENMDNEKKGGLDGWLEKGRNRRLGGK